MAREEGSGGGAEKEIDREVIPPIYSGDNKVSGR